MTVYMVVNGAGLLVAVTDSIRAGVAVLPGPSAVARYLHYCMVKADALPSIMNSHRQEVGSTDRGHERSLVPSSSARHYFCKVPGCILALGITYNTVDLPVGCSREFAA